MATGSRTPWVRQQFFDDNGDPLSGGLIDTYIAGSTTAVDTYTDITLTTTHTNPIVLNSRGETTIFLDPAVAYKFVLRNPLPDGSEIWTQDNITALGGGSLLTDLGVVRSKVVGSATLPVPLATNVVIPYDTADYEVNLTGFDGATNKWVCPLAGVYDLNAAVDFTIQSNAALPSATCEIFFLVNGVTAKNQKLWAFTTDANGGQKTLETSGTLQLSKNDEVQVIFVSPLQGSGTSIDLILINAFWEIISLSGVKGDQGDQGPAGPAGQGVPAGGTANQVLAKIDGTDYNTHWVDDSTIVVPGASGEVLGSDGSGGIIAFDGSGPTTPKLAFDPSLNHIDSPASPLGATGFIASGGFIYLNSNAGNNLGEFQFRDNAGNTFGKIIGNSSLNTLLINTFSKVIIGDPLEILSSTTLTPAQVIDPGTNTNKVMLVMDFTTGALERRPIVTGSPSQGSQYVLNVSDGAGGWQALDGISLPLFQLNSVTGYLEFTGASGFITNVLEATSQVNISNDAGGLYFRDSSQVLMLDLSVQKDLYGAGLHQLDLTGAHRFDIGCEININTFDPGTDTGKKMLVIDTATNKVEERPIPSGGAPSQGSSGIINIADGAGGWLAMDGVSLPLFEWSSTTGDLSFTGGNFVITETFQATTKFDVANDIGQLRFRDTADTTTLARFRINKDALGAGLHELGLFEAKRFTIPNDFRVQGDVSFTGVVDPGTDTGKKMLVIDTTTKEIQERPIPAGSGLPSDFIICTTAAEVRAALALAQDYKTIFLQTLAAATVTPSATNTPIDVYGQNVILGSTSAITFSTITPVETLQFQRTSAAYTSIRPLGMLTSLLPGSIPPNNIVELDNVKIISEMLSVPPWGFTVNGAGLGELTWTETLDANIPIQGTVTARQNFQYDWGMVNTFTVRDETELLKYLQIDIPVKNLYVVTDTISLSSNTISDVKGRINIYGTNLSISIASAGTLSIESASTPVKEISFFVSRLNLINVTTLNLENVSFRARTLVNSPPGTTNVTSTSTGNGTLSYENPDLTGTVTFTGAATQTFWDNTLIDAFGRLPAVDGSNLTNITALDNTKLAILNNLSDLNSASIARTNLGLGSAAVADLGTSPGNAVQLDASSRLPAVDGSQLTNVTAFDNTKLAILNNLSDLNSASIARTNLGLGTSAVFDVGTGATNIVQLDATGKLPAVDGSQLTNLPGGGTPAPQSVMVLKSNVDTATFTKASPLLIPWNLEKYKDAGFSHSNTTNNTRAIVTSAGTYQVSGRLRILSATAQRVQPTIKILINGVVQNWSLDSGYIRNAGGSSDYWTLEFTYEPEKLSANDYLELELSLEAQNPGTYTGTLIGSESSFSVINLQGTQGIQGPAGPGGTDTNAVHVNVANEIAQITAKTAPLDPDDVLILEDSEDSYNKKSITIGDLPIPATSKKSEVVSYVKAGISNGANVAFTTRSAFTNPHFFTTNSGINWNIKKVSLNSAFGLFNVASFELVLEYVAVDTAWAIGSGTNLHSETFTSITKNVPNNVISGSAITVAVPNNVNIFAYFKLNSGIYSITDAEIIVQLEEQ